MQQTLLSFAQGYERKNIFKKQIHNEVILYSYQAANAGIKTDEYREYATKQIGYMLGDNGRSFLVGFGDNYPKQPHHKAAACDSIPAECTWDTFNDVSNPNPHELLGALVGGPNDLSDTYTDLRTDYISNEVTLDYNAGFTGAVAGLKALACNGNNQGTTGR